MKNVNELGESSLVSSLSESCFMILQLHFLMRTCSGNQPLLAELQSFYLYSVFCAMSIFPSTRLVYHYDRE